MVKTLTVLGARPQFIKAAPVLPLLKDDILVHTGQHYDKCMTDIFFDGLDIKEPDYHLSIGSGTNHYQVISVMQGVENIINIEHPEMVLVYGDTNSTLGAALAAKNQNVKLVHIEAGLRSHNYDMPEEFNRVITDRIADLRLCPTESAYHNLKKENLGKRSHVVGDTMYDLLIQKKKEYNTEILKQLKIVKKDYYLCTIHRAGNVDEPDKLNEIFSAFAKVKQTIILPLHPRTKKNIDNFSIILPGNVRVIEPVNYINMMILIASASVVITDSGGIQKEAHILETPCVTLRNETEWEETIITGWNILTKIDKDEIVKNINHDFPHKQNFHPYGDGEAAEKIVEFVYG